VNNKKIMDELKEIGDELISYVEDIFPEGSEVKQEIDFDSENYKCHISWLLKNDAIRPNKRSKIIIIRISRETLSEYKISKSKSTLQIKFISYIKELYANFNPEHNNTKNQAPPIEEWLISSEIFNS